MKTVPERHGFLYRIMIIYNAVTHVGILVKTVIISIVYQFLMLHFPHGIKIERLTALVLRKSVAR